MNIFKKIALVTVILSGVLAAAAPLVYAADFQGNACQGLNVLNGDKPSTNCGTSGETGVRKLVGDVVNILSLIIGVAAVIMIIVGGLKYATSGGDTNAVSSAKNTVLYALVGLVVAVLAQFLVHFVIMQVTEKTCATNPSIPATSRDCKPKP